MEFSKSFFHNFFPPIFWCSDVGLSYSWRDSLCLQGVVFPTWDSNLGSLVLTGFFLIHLAEQVQAISCTQLVLNFNISSPRHGSGTLLNSNLVTSNLFIQQCGKICCRSGFIQNLKSLYLNPIGVKSANCGGCPERWCGSGKLLNSTS